MEEEEEERHCLTLILVCSSWLNILISTCSRCSREVDVSP